jgi:uncharacterized protein (UPF0305 family)
MFKREEVADLMTEEDLDIFERIAGITEKAALAEALMAELARYSVFEIMKIRADLDREIERLPSPYREKVRPYFIEWQIGRYTKLMAMWSRGDLNGLAGPIEKPDLYGEFCATESMRLKERHENVQDDDDTTFNPFLSLYYLQLSCFYMFVLDEPGHPVGMPFPGGLRSRDARTRSIARSATRRRTSRFPSATSARPGRTRKICKAIDYEKLRWTF